MLRTESHGTVEAGFFSVFTQFSRLGEYAFATSHLCKLVQQFAQHPAVREGRVLGYDLDKFWQRQTEYFQELLEMVSRQVMLADAMGHYPSELPYTESDQRRMEQAQGEVLLEDEVDIYNEGKIVPVKISQDGHAITIGDYRIFAIHFARMAVYLARGGLFGWMKDRKPDFSEPTLQAIRTSKNPLFRGVQRSG
jgi:hypothetical protein